MDLMLSADQEAIQASVRSFLDDELPMARVREIAQGGAKALSPLWRAAGALGFFGLAVPEAAGGAGYAITEEMVLFEELGRVLAPGPWLGSVLAAHALATAGNPHADLARIVAGEQQVAIVDATSAASSIVVRGNEVSGESGYVADGDADTAFLVVAPSAILYVASGSGAQVERRPSMDPTRAIAVVRFAGVRGAVIAEGSDAVAALLRRATLLSCAEAVGGIQRTVDMSVEYGKVRKQFDKPIGSFQAVKHRCADMAVRAEVARSATTYAIVSVRDGTADQDFQVSVAKILASGAYVQNAADNVQNHGGMGFTWECDAHLFVKRARSFEAAFGSRLARLDQLAESFRGA
ncbi:acyl-CoA/acyl-ACP dehydrogenase [Candidatus Binatia bacterium]|jgi:alkylation response protein AidB-like acyl-CoA dehydrogenase|nr:acyl-CoA/acyl-ACP dehydrogenase [Candidatus Binatia bacterium]